MTSEEARLALARLSISTGLRGVRSLAGGAKAYPFGTNLKVQIRAGEATVWETERGYDCLLARLNVKGLESIDKFSGKLRFTFKTGEYSSWRIEGEDE